MPTSTLRAPQRSTSPPPTSVPAAPPASMIVSAALPVAFDSVNSATKYAGTNAWTPK